MGLVWSQLGSGFECKFGFKQTPQRPHAGIFVLCGSGNATSSEIIDIFKDTADE